MWAALPIAVVGALYAVLRRTTSEGRRSAFLIALVVAGCYLTVVTEALSLWHAFSMVPLAAAWALPLMLLGGIQLSGWRDPSRDSSRPGGEKSSFGALDVLLLLPLFLIPAATGVTALIGPPNTIDSLAYHMSRVAHWMANRSVEHYPTYIPRQLHMAPFAEYAIAHLQILSGSDRFANLVQWGAIIGSLAGASLIAEQLGAGPRVRLITMAAVVTVPMAILQASNTQNNAVAALWLLVFVYAGLRFAAVGKLPLLALSSAALALGVLTKATVYVIAFPFAVLIAARSVGWIRRKPVPVLAIPVAILLSLNAGHFLRNASTFGSPLGPPGEGSSPAFRYLNSTFTPAGFAANLLRNFGIHCQSPSRRLNRWLDGAITKTGAAIDIPLNPPEFTWDSRRFKIVGNSTDEDYAGALAHLVLVSSALAVALFEGRRLPRPARDQLLACGAAFLLFSAVIRWQPWHTRLLFPLSVLFLPAAVQVLAARLGQKALTAAAVLLSVNAFPYLVKGDPTPWIGPGSIFHNSRADLYFQKCSRLKGSYENAARYLSARPEARVGLLLLSSEVEYPLWALTGYRINFEHVLVDNVTAMHVSTDALPATLVVIANRAEAIQPAIPGYRRTAHFGMISVLEKKTGKGRDRHRPIPGPPAVEP